MSVKKVKITFSYELETTLKEDQKPEDVLDTYSYVYGFKNMKIIKVEEI